jgi:hypothetical protein
MFYGAAKLRTIRGIFDLSQSTDNAGMFSSANSLENVAFAPLSIKASISFANSLSLSTNSIQSIVDGLADLTGSTAQTLTLHATVGAKLTQTQKDTIAAKNWTVTY